MAAKQQKVKFGKTKTRIPINPEYSNGEKLSIAQDIIDLVVTRTNKKKDREGKTFNPGYSKSYAKTPEAKAAGKRKGQTPNLKLSGDMLLALGEHTKISKSFIEIGYNKDSTENAKADGNVRGTYGKSRASSKKARDFMGITEDELKTVLADYPIGDKRASAKSVRDNILAKAIADKVAGKVGVE